MGKMIFSTFLFSFSWFACILHVFPNDFRGFLHVLPTSCMFFLWFPRIVPGIPHVTDLDDGNIYREPMIFMVKTVKHHGFLIPEIHWAMDFPRFFSRRCPATNGAGATPRAWCPASPSARGRGRRARTGDRYVSGVPESSSGPVTMGRTWEFPWDFRISMDFHGFQKWDPQLAFEGNAWEWGPDFFQLLSFWFREGKEGAIGIFFHVLFSSHIPKTSYNITQFHSSWELFLFINFEHIFCGWTLQ